MPCFCPCTADDSPLVCCICQCLLSTNSNKKSAQALDLAGIAKTAKLEAAGELVRATIAVQETLLTAAHQKELEGWLKSSKVSCVTDALSVASG